MTKTKTTEQDQTARALEIAGEAETLSEALDQWELERETIADLYDENQALGILHRQLDLALTLAGNIIDQVETEAAMFLTQPTRNKIEQFRSLIKNEEKRRAEVKQLIAEAADRRKVTDSTERKKNNAT